MLQGGVYSYSCDCCVVPPLQLMHGRGTSMPPLLLHPNIAKLPCSRAKALNAHSPLHPRERLSPSAVHCRRDAPRRAGAAGAPGPSAAEAMPPPPLPLHRGIVELVAGEGGDGGSLGGSSPRSSRGGRAEKRGKDKDKKERKKKSVHKKRERRAACGPQPVCRWCAVPRFDRPEYLLLLELYGIPLQVSV